MVRSEEFFRLVAFAKLVGMIQVLRSDIPLWRVGEFFTTVAADVGAIPG